MMMQGLTVPNERYRGSFRGEPGLGESKLG